MATYGKQIGAGGSAGVINSSLQGSGTAGSPWGVNDWLANRMIEIQAIVPSLTRGIQYDTWSITGDVTTNAASGTGVTKPATTVPGGAWDFSSGTTAGSQQILVSRDFSAGNPPRPVTSARASVWATVARVQTLVSPDSVTRYTFGDCADSSSDVWLGLDGSVSTTNISVRTVSGGDTNFTFNLVWPGNGTWHDVAMVFDGTQLWAMLDGVKSSAAYTTLTNFPAGAAGGFRLFAANGTTAANREFLMAKYALITADV